MTTKSIHTAAPWSIEWGTAQGGDGHWVVDSQDLGPLSRVAMVAFHDDKNDGETKANARLIAAAPELLEAIIACCDQLDGWVMEGSLDPADAAAVRLARGAISKATGVEKQKRILG